MKRLVRKRAARRCGPSAVSLEWLESRRLLACDRLDGRAPLDVPALTSDPAAYKKLYLDFDGDIFRRWGSWAGIGGTDTRGPIPAYDIDGDPTCFSQAELQNIRDIYSIVKEKFSIFDIDVTTIDPGSLDDGRAGKIVIGGDGLWYSATAGGVAMMDGFYGSGESVGYVWEAPANVRYVGETIAHEAAHFLGLKHQSLYAPDGRLLDEYRWRFIMGAGDLGVPGGRWGVGTSTGRDSFDGSIDRDGDLQDDIAKLVSKGLTLRADDHGDTRTAASPMALSDFGFTAGGILERETDVDFFRVSGVTPGTLVTFAVRGNALAPMLDARLEVYDAVGTLVAAAETADVYDETFVLASSVSSTYYVAVRAAANPADEYNVGQYQLDVGLGAFADDTPAGATLLTGIEEFDGASPQLRGRQFVSGFVSSADKWDWYAFELASGMTARVALSGLSADVDLYAFEQNDTGGIGRLLFASTNGGALSESGAVDRVIRSSVTRIFVGVQHVSGGMTGYRLMATSDEDRRSLLVISPSGPEPWLSGGTRDYYGFVDPGDSDLFQAFRGVPRELRTTLAAHLSLTTYSENARLNLGFDLNRDGWLDADEVLETHVAPPGGEATAVNVPLSNAEGRGLLVSVDAFGLNETNYRLRVRPEVYRPSLDANLRDLGLASLDVSLTRHAVRLIDLLDDGAPVQVVALSTPPPGPVEIGVTPLDQGLVEYSLVRDANEDGIVDKGEIVASGMAMKLNVPADDLAPYYFVAALSPQSNVRSASFEMIFRDAVALATAGTGPQVPLELPLQSQVPLPGYLVSDREGGFHRPIGYHRFVVKQAGQLGIDLAFESPTMSAAGDPRQLQLGVGKDRNQDGLLDAGERVLTRTKEAKDYLSMSLDVVLDPGEYLATVELVAGEASPDEPMGIDYVLATRFGAALDTTPVQVLATETRLLEGAMAVELTFSDDVRASLAAGEILIRTTEAPFRSVEPLVQSYDEQSQTLTMILDPGEREGGYEVRIAAGSIADHLGNALADDFHYPFRLLTVASGSQHDDMVHSGGTRLLKLGAGTLIFDKANSHSGGTVVEEGRVVVRNLAALGTGALDVRAGATVRLEVGFGTVALPRLALATGAILDLGEARLTIGPGGADEATVRQWIIAARGSGDWNGSGGITSWAAAAASGSRTIGSIVRPDGSATVVFTAIGDLDLDRDVDVFDLLAMSTGGRYGSGTAATWSQGDVNYDGRATVFDLISINTGGRYGRGSIVTASTTAVFARLAAGIAWENLASAGSPRRPG